MAIYNPTGLAVPKMDDDSPADMSTVFSDTDVTEASTLTMMVTDITMENTDTNPSYNPWHNSKYKCRWQQMY